MHLTSQDPDFKGKNANGSDVSRRMSHLRLAHRNKRALLSATPLSQTKALYLAGLCFRQGFDEQDAARVFKGGDD